MKRGHVYTFVYMVGVTAVLVFLLAAAYEAFKPAISRNRDIREQRAVLYVLGLDEGLKDDMVWDSYVANVQPASLNGFDQVKGKPVLAYVTEGQTAAYAVPFEGAGLWGSLRGYLGVSADLSHTTGIVFTYQNETPGLGGRIDEEAFKAKFRGIPIAAGQSLLYGRQEPDKPDAVTGATQTSQAVLRTVNELLRTVIFPEGGQTNGK